MDNHGRADLNEDPLLGQVLDGRFEIVEYIAKGGMGEIYKAIQHPLNRIVAIKRLSYTSEKYRVEFRRRFFLEASLCGRLTHPNIIRIFDYGCHNETVYYIAMEYLEGQTLHQLIKKNGTLEPSLAVSVLKQICAGLVEAHDAGLVHRDLKPSNLFTVPNALGGDFIKILDFGVVKQLHEDKNLDLSQTQTTVGSPLFMSPEQIEDGDLDARSDLYSLGIILFYMLTGTLPFKSSNTLKIFAMHLSTPPPTFAQANPNVQVPQELEQIAQCAMRKSRDDRFADTRAMLRALDALGDDLPRYDSTLRKIPKPSVSDTQGGEESSTVLPTGVFGDLGLKGTSLVDHFSVDNSALSVESCESNMSLSDMDLHGYVAFIDLNCPYCFAFHERACRWGLADKLEWRLVEHASHLLDGPFDQNQEQMLSAEVFEVHHRAPEIELILPLNRCRSTKATRLITYVQRQFPEQISHFRQIVYRALWQEGRDIGDLDVLKNLLIAQGLPEALLDLCSDEPPELSASQKDWENGNFDSCIPVLAHPSSGRVLIGLSDESTLIEFFGGDRTRVVDNTVCFYQPKPTILLCGWMSHLWPILSDFRDSCEILQAPTSKGASEHLSELAVPNLLLVEGENVTLEAIQDLADLARSRSVPWVVASRVPDPKEEVQFLSMGAVEYLPLTDDGHEVANARLGRILRDRYNLERVEQETRVDGLTNLPTRHRLLEHLGHEWERAQQDGSDLSLVLVNLDNFKDYNRAHGYLCGDRCLIQLAGLLKKQCSQPGHLLARFGGNEFILLLPATSCGKAKEIAEQLRQCILLAKIENKAGTEGILSASVGVHTITGKTKTSIYELVDVATQDLKTSREQRHTAI